MPDYRIRRADGKYLAQEERGGLRWVDRPEEAFVSHSEADAQQIIVLIRGGAGPSMKPEPVGEETGGGQDPNSRPQD